MTDPELVNIGTAERPNWVNKDLAWSRSFQGEEDHHAESLASGSTLPSGVDHKVPPSTSDEQHP